MLSQRLIRVLCKDCKQAYKPNPDFLKKAGLPSTITNLYRKPAGGDDNPNVDVCDNCGGVGFKGRTGMFEFLEMSEAMKETIKGGGDVNAIRATMRAEKMLTLQQDALRLVAEGKTSLDEVQRIFKSA
jgi:type IV pilus assembly protein PilB